MWDYDFKRQLLRYFTLNLQKKCTPNLVFRELIIEKTNIFENNGWPSLFTDGSENNDLYSPYAVGQATQGKSKLVTSYTKVSQHLQLKLELFFRP